MSSERMDLIERREYGGRDAYAALTAALDAKRARAKGGE